MGTEFLKLDHMAGKQCTLSTADEGGPVSTTALAHKPERRHTLL